MPKIPYHYQYNHPYFIQKFGSNKFNVTDDSQLSGVNHHHYEPVNETMSCSSKLSHHESSESENDTQQQNSSAYSFINNNYYSHHHNNLSVNKNSNIDENYSKFCVEYLNDFNKVFDLQQNRSDLNMLNFRKSLLHEHQVNTFIDQVINSNSSGSKTVSTSQDYLSNKNYKKARFLSNNELLTDTSKAPLADEIKCMKSDKLHNNSYYHRINSFSDNQNGNLDF
jgi:hypothetical protein